MADDRTGAGALSSTVPGRVLWPDGWLAFVAKSLMPEVRVLAADRVSTLQAASQGPVGPCPFLPALRLSTARED